MARAGVCLVSATQPTGNITHYLLLPLRFCESYGDSQLAPIENCSSDLFLSIDWQSEMTSIEGNTEAE